MNGLCLIKNDSVYSKGGGNISVVNAEKPGVVLYADVNGQITEMSAQTFNVISVYDTVLGSSIQSITYESKIGGYWIGTHGRGILRYDLNGFTIFDMVNSGMPSNNVNDIIIDNMGNKWIATNDKGLVKFDGSTWVVYDSANSGLTSNKLKSLCFDRNNNLWIGTINHGVTKYNGATWINYNTWNSKIAFDAITKIVSDSSGNIWVGTFNGLSKINAGIWLEDNRAMSEGSKARDFDLWPNPAIYNVFIKPNFKESGMFLFELCDVGGNLVYENQFDSESSVIDISLHKVKSGIYMYRIRNENYFTTGKLIVIR
jgi:hypothetical protein